GQAMLQLHNVVDVAGTTSIGGPPVTTTIAKIGRASCRERTCSQGQVVSLIASNVVLGCNNASFSILNPDGSPLGTTGGVCGQTVFLAPQRWHANGNYAWSADANSSVPGQAMLQLHNVVDVAGTTSIGGPPVTTTIA